MATQRRIQDWTDAEVGQALRDQRELMQKTLETSLINKLPRVEVDPQFMALHIHTTTEAASRLLGLS